MMPLFNVDIFDRATVCGIEFAAKTRAKRAWMDFKSNYKIAIFFFQLAIRVINQNYPFRIFAQKNRVHLSCNIFRIHFTTVKVHTYKGDNCLRNSIF